MDFAQIVQLLQVALPIVQPFLVAALTSLGAMLAKRLASGLETLREREAVKRLIPVGAPFVGAFLGAMIGEPSLHDIVVGALSGSGAVGLHQIRVQATKPSLPPPADLRSVRGSGDGV